ncbi:hypothetical protein E8E11_008211 [Didymella keratinophila]|nr:hypothetical protein E8E11_008211 [Didymella keratinophila]
MDTSILFYGAGAGLSVLAVPLAIKLKIIPTLSKPKTEAIEPGIATGKLTVDRAAHINSLKSTFSAINREKAAADADMRNLMTTLQGVEADNKAKDAWIAHRDTEISGLKRKVVDVSKDLDTMLTQRKKRRDADRRRDAEHREADQKEEEVARKYGHASAMASLTFQDIRTIALAQFLEAYHALPPLVKTKDGERERPIPKRVYPAYSPIGPPLGMDAAWGQGHAYGAAHEHTITHGGSYQQVASLRGQLNEERGARMRAERDPAAERSAHSWTRSELQTGRRATPS